MSLTLGIDTSTDVRVGLATDGAVEGAAEGVELHVADLELDRHFGSFAGDDVVDELAPMWNTVSARSSLGSRLSSCR